MKNLLSLMTLTKTELNQIFDVASQMRRIATAGYKKGPQLIGSVVGTVYAKPNPSSTAFALATNYLSGTVCPVFASDDVLQQCRAMDNMGVNAVVVASENDNLVQTFANSARCGVVNAGSGQYDPIGVLADLLTLHDKLDTLQNVSVSVVGNKHTNKINEFARCLQLFGSDLIWYLPTEDFVTPRKGIVIDNIEGAFSGADAIVDIGLSAFSDPAKYYGSTGGIPEKFVDLARIDVPLLGSRHVVDNIGSKIYLHNCVTVRDTNYVSVAMAVLYLMHKV